MTSAVYSEKTQEVNCLFSGLQIYLVSKLNALSLQVGEGKSCKSSLWKYNKDIDVGGKIYESRDKTLFNKVSIDVSNQKSDSVFSATIHPHNPHVPSLHIFASYKMKKNEKFSWQIMAELNPSILNEASLDQRIFLDTVKKASGTFFDEGVVRGDNYFYIPELYRYRGVFHYYLDAYTQGSFEEEKAFVLAFYETVISCYISIFSAKQLLKHSLREEKIEEQLAYHTLFFFHVLIKDPITIESLEVHNQNDLALLSSLPAYINKDILSLWVGKVQVPQDILLKQIVKILPNVVPTVINEKTKIKLIHILRKHYKKHPLENHS